MNKNNKNNTVHNEQKRTLVPELRFPEFHNAGAWDTVYLGIIAHNLDNKRIPITENDRSKGHIPYYGASGVVDYVNDFIFDENLLCVSEDGANLTARTYPIAFSISGKSWINNHAHVLKFQNMATQKIVENYLNSIKLDDFLTGMAQPKLNKAMLDIIPISLPELPEQQKIADCLSSIDELITAQAQKLDSLKFHKKGLMQQLFPADGEKLPKFRFSEFRNAGVWEEKYLKEISPSIFDGTHQTPTYTNEGVSFYSVENIVSGSKNKFISHDDYIAATIKNKPEKGDILLTRIGNIGCSKVVTWDYEFSIYVTLAVIKQSELFNSHYLSFFMQSERYQTEILKKSLLNAVPCKINMDSLRMTNVLLPEFLEQQKIADCLSSIDALITAQAQKLDAIKAHKKGLMQRLFPKCFENSY